MSEQRVLVVGAGALGVVTAYHLQLSGADISFFVRPNRLAQMTQPLRLYNYATRQVDPLQHCKILTDITAVAASRFDFVLITLDGAACRSHEGIALLRSLGQALAGTGTRLIICGVGLGLYEHVKNHTGFDDADLLEGTMASFAYQVGRPHTPQPPQDDETIHDDCDFAYLTFGKNRDFLIAGHRAATRAFAALYGRSGAVTCVRMPRKLFRSATASYVAFTTACELTGWQSLEAVIDDTALWPLCCRSQREIFGLKEHGWPGKFMAWMMTDKRLRDLMLQTQLDAEPMGYIAFYHFHHGGKVRAQNILGMENALKSGAHQGRDMSATRELLTRYLDLADTAETSL